MTARRMLILPGVALAMLALAFAACSGGDDDGSPTPTPAGNGGPIPTIGGDPDPPNGEFDACSLITREEVVTALGEEVDEGLSEQADPIYFCSFETEDFDSVSISYLTGERDEVETYFELGNEESEVIDGLGEKAYWNEQFSDLEIFLGERYLSVSVFSDDVDQLEAARSLAEKALGRLP